MDTVIQICEVHGIKYRDCKCCLEYKNIKDELILNKCLCCRLRLAICLFKMWFAIAYKFSSYYINKFILLLQKGVYLYDYINDWQKCYENYKNYFRRKVFTVT